MSEVTLNPNEKLKLHIGDKSYDLEKIISDIIILRAEMLALKNDLQFKIDILFSNSNQYIDTAVDFNRRIEILEECMYGGELYSKEYREGILKRLYNLEQLEEKGFDNFTTLLAKDMAIINIRLNKLEAKQ